MDHVALDRTGPDDRHLDDEVIEGARLHAGQHRHLRPALNLEDPESIGLPDHRIGARVLRRDGREIEVDALVLAKEIEPPAHAREHPQRQHVDLHELQRVDIVLVPFDHLSVFHRGGFNRDQFVQAVLCQDEAAGMLRQVARSADQFAREFERQPQSAVGHIEIEFARKLLARPLGRPMAELLRQEADHVLGQA
ncbi:hypothetical protein D3C73_947710 [compost metagenome]